jgi:hypothetical protein
MPFMAEETVDSLIHRVEKAEGKVALIKKKSAEVTKEVVMIAEVVGGAAAVAFINAKYGNSDDGTYYQLAGIPLDLGAAAALHAAAWFGLAGDKYEDDLHEVANGALAAWTVRTVTAMANKTKAAPAATTRGLLGAGGFTGGGFGRSPAFAVAGR